MKVHERGVEADFILLLIKRYLDKYPHLKLVLMSATAQSEIFSKYFGNAPIVTIPGRVFPVQEYFLEDFYNADGNKEREEGDKNEEEENSYLFF